ncbi:SH3 domain-containing protein [Sulfuritalea sp.]|uniref:SH3 domain-containing protein n=1 Tax=Sulfuritalea sp. TaxID=2480090 RepID=UPI00286DC584|nr:SH3 domain-containing protein [Sulfuritalea sp.]
MMAARRFTAFVVGLAALAAAPAAHALDYLSLAEAAPAYDAPSAKARPLFVVLAGTPVELVVGLDGWSKVRDSRGELVWIEKKHLTDKRNVIVRVDRAQVRAAAEDQAALVFEAERDVVLEFVESVPGGWVKVRHRDGQSGFLKVPQVWGL